MKYLSSPCSPHARAQHRTEPTFPQGSKGPGNLQTLTTAVIRELRVSSLTSTHHMAPEGQRSTGQGVAGTQRINDEHTEEPLTHALQQDGDFSRLHAFCFSATIFLI